MKIQPMIISILALSTACEVIPKQQYEATGGDCPDPEDVSFDGDIVASVLRSTVDTEADNPDLNVDCYNICTTAIYSEENRYPEEVLSCEYSFDFESLPEDFASWADSDVVGTLTCDAQFVTMCMGRRPLGHVESKTAIRDLGSHFAAAAHLEQASVTAFADLARQAAWST